MSGETRSGARARPARRAKAAAGSGFDLKDLVDLYMQQVGMVNQLWAMYAATTFAAGAFAMAAWFDRPGGGAA